jgi:hypothetical protein
VVSVSIIDMIGQRREVEEEEEVVVVVVVAVEGK